MTGGGSAVLLLSAVAGNLLDVEFGDDATFKISLRGSRWIESGALRAFADGAWQNLTRMGAARRSAGSDALGHFECVNVSWSWPPAGVLHTSLKSYAALDAAVFSQQLPHGAARTNASNPLLPGSCVSVIWRRAAGVARLLDVAVAHGHG